MKFQPPCIDCSKRQGVRVYKLALEAMGIPSSDGNENILREELNGLIDSAETTLSPAELSLIAIRAAERHAEASDPFDEIKKQTNSLALSLYPQMKERIEQSDNPLHLACQLAACGNIIDLGIQEEFDILGTIEKVLSEGFKLNEYNDFITQLQQNEKKSKTTRLLYLCDNAGEIVFDMLFMEELKKHFHHLKITAAVNHGPVLNDATIVDAKAVQLDKIVSVIDNGTSELGTVLDKSSPEFLAAYHAADVIISKGQANYETLSHREENIFFILKAKCDVIAESLSVQLYDAVMTRSPYLLARQAG